MVTKKYSQRNTRNIKYERMFMKYLFRGDIQRHKAICKQINVKPNIK